ncbi:MAG: nucleotidyltransferase domain-containing protein [Candidatus Bathyarchaeia archaeon]
MVKAVSALKSQERAFEIIERFIENAKRLCSMKGLLLREAYLVGSRARGDYLEDSDIDLVLIVEGVEGMDQLERRRAFVEALEKEMETFVYTPKEWHSDGSLWIRELKKEAVKIS